MQPRTETTRDIFLGFCRRLQNFFLLSFSPCPPPCSSFSSTTPSFVYYAAATSPSVFKLASKSRLFFLFLRKKRVCGSLGASAPATYMYLSVYLYPTISGYELRNVVFIELSGSVISRVARNSFTHYRYYISNIKFREVSAHAAVVFFFLFDRMMCLSSSYRDNNVHDIMYENTHATFCSHSRNVLMRNIRRLKPHVFTLSIFLSLSLTLSLSLLF